MVFTTFYDVDIPKMNIQGNHSCIRKFVLDIIPEIYKKIKDGIGAIESDKTKSNPKQSLAGDSNFMCEVCSKPYTRKSFFEKHMLKHAQTADPKDIEEDEDRLDRSKDNCPTCELPKGKSKAISCSKCRINFHPDCVVGDKDKLNIKLAKPPRPLSLSWEILVGVFILPSNHTFALWILSQV